jgi:hypothetical protein
LQRINPLPEKRGHQFGGLSYSRHAENYRALFANDAAYNPTAGSHSCSLIQVKIHSLMSACSNSKAAGNTQPTALPSSRKTVPCPHPHTASVGFVELE